MATKNNFKVGVYGHSHVRRMRQQLGQGGVGLDQDAVQVKMVAQGGLTLNDQRGEKLVSELSLGEVETLIICMGDNDLRFYEGLNQDICLSANSLAVRLLDFGESLMMRLGCKEVIFMSLLPRYYSSGARSQVGDPIKYNLIGSKTNEILNNLCSARDNFFFHRFRCRFPDENMKSYQDMCDSFLSDGVHLKESAYKTIYLSGIKNAIIQACRRRNK